MIQKFTALCALLVLAGCGPVPPCETFVPFQKGQLVSFHGVETVRIVHLWTRPSFDKRCIKADGRVLTRAAFTGAYDIRFKDGFRMNQVSHDRLAPIYPESSGDTE